MSLLKSIKKSQTVTNTISLGIGSLLSQVMVLISILITSRLYNVEQFGIFGSFQSIVSILWVFATLRLELAVSLSKEIKEKIDIIRIILVVSLIFTIFLAFILTGIFLFSHFGILKVAFPFQLLLIPISVLLLAVYLSFEAFLISQNSFKTLATSKVLQGLSMSIVHIALGYLYPSTLGLILGYFCGTFASLAYIIYKNWFTIKPLFNLSKLEETYHNLGTVIKAYISYPKLSMPSILMNLASFHISVILVGIVFNAKEAGYFFMAQRILGIPVDLITNSISQVFLSNANSLIRESPRKLYDRYIQLIKYGSLIAIIPSILVMIAAPLVIKFVLGENWYETGKHISILTIMYYFRLVLTPLSHILNVLKKLKTQLAWDSMRFFSIVILFVYCYFFKVEMINFVLLFSLLMSILYIIHSYLGFKYLKDLTNATKEA